MTITNTYDRAGRVKTRTYSGEPAGQQTPAVSFYYDGKGFAQQQTPNYAKGKLTKVDNTVSATLYSQFDNFGRITESSQITDGQTYTSSYQYNLSGALVQETYPSGRVVKNDFESDGDLLTVTSKKAGTSVFRQYASNFSYTASGGISQMRLGNGKWETAVFNPRQQVTELGLGSSASNAGLWKVNYTYGEFDEYWNVDANKNTGNIAKQTLTIPGATFVQNYRYDSLYRLKDAVEPGGSTANWTQTFDYDRYGNRTSFIQTVGGVTTHNSTPAVSNGVNGTNRFTSTDFEYDKNGNLVGDVDPATSQGRDFLFNGDNKQIEVIVNGVSVGQYFYDGEGKRVKKVVGNETTVFVYSSGKLVAEYSTTGPPTEGHINYTTTDHLGSPRVITNELGRVTSRRDFMPFGEDLPASVGNRSANAEYTAGDQVRQKFTGYQKDEETKLDFAEARMYENRFGRFTAVDPLLASGKSANPQTFNRFIYVGNNPIVVTDPLGLDWYRKSIKDSERYEYDWFDDDPGNGWGKVDFGRFTATYTTVENWCSSDSCNGQTAYLYKSGGRDFGERANYGLGDAVIDTGIGSAKWAWNGMAFGSEAIYGAFGKLSWEYAFTGRPREMPSVRYFEYSNQVQANAGTAMTMVSFLAPAFGKSPRTPVAYPGFSTANVGGTATGVAIQYEQYALRAMDDGMYPVMQRGSKEPVGSVFLKEGDVWKFGQTINGPARYSERFLTNTGSGLRFDSQFTTPSYKSVLQIERQKIIEYQQRFGVLPPGNKIRR